MLPSLSSINRFAFFSCIIFDEHEMMALLWLLKENIESKGAEYEKIGSEFHI